MDFSWLQDHLVLFSVKDRFHVYLKKVDKESDSYD